jgi:hypothetical protein
MLNRIARWMREALRWVRYMYFLRFSILMLAFPVLFVRLNNTGASSIVRGILVPEFRGQYLCVAFFQVSAGFAALIVARVVLAHGPERFNEGIPWLLRGLLVHERAHWISEFFAVVLFQLPGLYVLVTIAGKSQLEGVLPSQIWSGILPGAALAAAIWWSANAWFYLAYDVPAAPPPPPPALTMLVLGKNAARTMLYPRAWFGLYRPGTPLAGMRGTLESAETPLRNSWVDRLVVRVAAFLDRIFKLNGYLYADGTPFEGHVFATVATVVFALIFFVIWPLAAPMPSVRASAIMLVALCIAALVILVFFWRATVPGGGGHLWFWQTILTIGVIGFVVAVFGLYFLSASNRFPVLAVLTLLVTLLLWTLSGIAFFADRYRVPVLTTLIVCMIMPRIFGVYGDREEHYLSTTSHLSSPTDAALASAPDNIPTPAAILDARLADLSDAKNIEADKPLIIVTATGGGLHASAWTAAVLAQLELRFEKEKIPFHQHLLLMSTVSGGSVGLLNYLRELQEPTPNWVRMQAAAQCSSLEAVGWGLIYYDAPKALVPLLPFAMASSGGDNDLDNTPLDKDRTWSLRKAFARNLHDDYCDQMRPEITNYFGVADSWTKPPFYKLHANLLNARAEINNLEKSLTLRNLLPTTQNQLPAFTMNTTTVELGERFLLANYQVPQYPLDRTSDLPAQSFLDTIGCCRDRTFDLPLATAAQMSATFPLVSSAARAPKDAEWHSVHFVDGGYYDNDGTASALEFLRYALASPDSGARDDEKKHLQSIQNKLHDPQHPLRILLIEIRNSPDPAEGSEAEVQKERTAGGGRGAGTEAWNMFSQLVAPLEGFWNAGHEGVTGRNRASLSLLERALEQQLRVHRIVFDDRNSQGEVGTDPLSWSLTPKQRAEVLSSSCPGKMTGKYDEAAKWYNQREWPNDALAPVPGAPANIKEIPVTDPNQPSPPAQLR